MTGENPFQDLPSDKVTELFQAKEFPDVSQVICGDIITRCWNCEIESAQQVQDLVQALQTNV